MLEAELQAELHAAMLTAELEAEMPTAELHEAVTMAVELTAAELTADGSAGS